MFKPIKDVVIIRPDNPIKGQRVSEGGILAPPGSYMGDICERVHFGTVIKIGNAVDLVKEGDRIIYGPYSTNPVGNDGLLVMRESDVMGVIK